MRLNSFTARAAPATMYGRRERPLVRVLHAFVCAMRGESAVAWRNDALGSALCAEMLFPSTECNAQVSTKVVSDSFESENDGGLSATDRPERSVGTHPMLQDFLLRPVGVPTQCMIVNSESANCALDVRASIGWRSLSR
jgi:hypothetical protein